MAKLKESKYIHDWSFLETQIFVFVFGHQNTICSPLIPLIPQVVTPGAYHRPQDGNVYLNIVYELFSFLRITFVNIF